MTFFLLMLGSLALMVVCAAALAAIFSIDWQTELLALLAADEDRPAEGGAEGAARGD